MAFKAIPGNAILMNPGKLDILGTIQTPAAVKDAAGTPVPTWSTFCTVWMNKITLNAREGVVSDQIVNYTTEEFKVRTGDISGVTAKMRLNVDTECWNIEQIVYVDRMYSKLICVKRDND